jgi:hypothetical protein
MNATEMLEYLTWRFSPLTSLHRYKDIGIVVLIAGEELVSVEFIEAVASGMSGRPRVEDVSRWLADLASSYVADAIFIDGPQGWKDPSNGHAHARACERELATPGKTGLPGLVNPDRGPGWPNSL